MDEIGIIDTLRRAAGGRRRPELALGIGDDCAVYRPRAGEELLFTTDMLLENVHFRLGTHAAAEVGRKALARALSDIAAMGGEPRFCLLSLALGQAVKDPWRRGFFRGFLAMTQEAGAPLAGGDLARAERTGCDVVVCGAAPAGKSLRRAGAKPGDAIYVSGLLGGSALGLRTRAGRAWKRHRSPEPRLRLGIFLRRAGATAAIDLSDGLSLDLRRLCLASGTAAEITSPPRFPGASEADALHGGEDYELLFTARDGDRIPVTFEGLPLTRIGTMRRGRAGQVRLAGRPLAPLGYDHFRKP